MVTSAAAAWQAGGCSVQGSSHKRTGLPNQDACEFAELNSVTLIAVADGHGGSRHFRSAAGSAFAVRVALSVLRDWAARANPQRAAMLIEQQWRAAIAEDLGRHPITEDEWANLSQSQDGAVAVASVQADPALAYGATLIAAAADDEAISLLQIGDGDVLAVSASGITTRPVPRDERLIANQTTSLCQPDSWKDFRTAVIRKAEFPALLLLSTDGYANSFRSEDDFLKIGSDYLTLLRERGAADVGQELPGILNEASEHGSGDDITLGLLWNPNAQEKPAQDAAPSASKTSLYAFLIPILLFLAVLGAVFLRRSTLRPETKTSGTSTKPILSRKGGGAPKPPQQWVLAIGSRRISLSPGTKISEQTFFGASKRNGVYAEVKLTDGAPVLVNDSDDVWTVIDGAKSSHPIAHGDSFRLQERSTVIARSRRANIVLVPAA